jgi:hypothetical protein
LSTVNTGFFVSIIILFFVCLILYRPGFKFFLLWLAICAIALFFLKPSVGVWGLFIYGFVWSSDGPSSENTEAKNTAASKNTFSDTSFNGVNNENKHRGTSYDTGEITYYSNGNSSIRYDDVTYFEDRIRSVQSGMVTYYFDENNRALGRSVDNGNGVHTYFDVNNNEIGHSYTSGRLTDFIGNCFEI